MTNIMDGDDKYFKIYQPNDEFWGLGVENETYFQLQHDLPVNKKSILNQKRERYSIDYNLNFKSDLLKTYQKIIFTNDYYQIPNFLNSHSITKCDINGEHKTLYNQISESNPKFTGTTIHEILINNDFFLSNYNKKYVFDGDTIEFMTSNFYKNTVNNIVDELVEFKSLFKDNLNSFTSKFGITLDYPKYNYGLVSFVTNEGSITPFNNGTYHVNLTLPTKLNADSEISDFDLFKSQHKNYINILQWLEPLIIGLYGSPDIYSLFGNEKYSLGSLRCTISRYIGIGTYNTDEMKQGKILNNPISETKLKDKENSWYKKLFENNGYSSDGKIGYDVNFNKHINSGVEIRFLDFFPEEYLPDLMNLFVLLGDHSLNNIDVKSIDEFQSWDDMVINALKYGYNAKCSIEYVTDLKNVLNLDKLEIKDYELQFVINHVIHNL